MSRSEFDNDKSDSTRQADVNAGTLVEPKRTALDGARRRLQFAVQQAQHGGLAGAVHADEADAGAGTDRPVEAVQNHPVSQLEPHPVQVEYVLAQARRRKALQHKRITRRRLVGDQFVGRLDPREMALVGKLPGVVKSSW